MDLRVVALTLALIAVITLAGCADNTNMDAEAPEESSNYLGVEALTPAEPELAGEEGDTVAFKVQCHVSEDVHLGDLAVRWQHTSSKGGMENMGQGYVDEDDTYAWETTFHDPGIHTVQAKCITTDMDLTDWQEWTLQIDPTDLPQPQDAPDDEDHAQPPDDEPTWDLDANLTVTIVDVGQGDAIVLQRANWTAIYDTGGRYASSHGALTDHLDATGTDTIDALFISHPHADHAGGCQALIQTYTVHTLHHPGIDHDTQTWQRCQDAIDTHDVPTLTGHDLDTAQTLTPIPSVDFTILHVDPTASHVHDATLALKATYHDFAIVLTGDLECDKENDVLDQGLNLTAPVLSLGHHGSSTSTCTPFLTAINPTIATAGVGQDNTYGHPHTEVLQRLADHDVDLYRTDMHGTTTITTNGTTWDITTQTGEPSYRHDTSEEEAEEDPEASELHVTATVSDPEPCQYTDVTVTITVEDEDGYPVEGATTTSTWNYKSSTPTEEGTTDHDGIDEHTRSISRATARYEVTVDVDIETDGQNGQAETSFTPQEC